MKPSNPNLLAVLSSREFFTADLYQFFLASGSHLFYTSAQTNLAVQTQQLSNDLIDDWNLFNITATKNVTGIDGLLSAWTMQTVPNAAAQYLIYDQTDNSNATKSRSQSVTFSAWVKAGTNRYAYLNYGGNTASTTYATVVFDVLLGVVTQVATLSSFVTTHVVAGPNGFFQISITVILNTADPNGYYSELGFAKTGTGNTFDNFGEANFSGATGSETLIVTDISYVSTQTYLAGGETGPYFDRRDNKAKVSWKLGTGNDQLVIDVVPGSATIGNLTFLDAIRCGVFDASDFQLSRAFMSAGAFGVVQGGCSVLLFQGRVAEADADRSLATFTINDYRELLSQQLPKNLYAASCANSFGDASCTVVVANFSENGTVQTGTTQSAIKTTLMRASDYYDMGKITFTSGQLLGLSFGVSTWIQGTPGTITPLSALPHVPAVGDTFTIAPGCDKTFTGGCTKYSNTPNFRGFPYVPAPETAV